MQRETHWPAIFAATFCGVAAAMTGKLPIALPQCAPSSIVMAGPLAGVDVHTMAFTSGVFVGIINGSPPVASCRRLVLADRRHRPCMLGTGASMLLVSR
jgi:hypothetical protein